jgi:tripartite ATP-independent transporter DctP family solute receptor
MHTVVDGEIGTELLNRLESGGIIGLGYMDAGSRSFYNNTRPISSLDDVKGLKIRVMQNPIFVEMINAMGGNGLPIAFNELYTAMQTGVVDGAENNPPTLFTSNQYTTVKYYTLTRHLIIPEIFVMSKVVYDKMTPAEQALVKKFAKEAQLEQRALWDKSVGEYTAKLKAAGVEFINIDTKPFYEATAPVRAKYGANYVELMKRINDTK